MAEGFALRYLHRLECGAAFGRGTLRLMKALPEKEEFLTARQLAEILQVSETTVRRLAQKRRIPCVRLSPRIIRFHLEAVREALDVSHRSPSHPLLRDEAQLSFGDLPSS